MTGKCLANLRDVTHVKLLSKFTLQLNNTRRGTAVAQWLRCCAKNLKVAGSIPDGVIGIFH